MYDLLRFYPPHSCQLYTFSISSFGGRMRIVEESGHFNPDWVDLLGLLLFFCPTHLRLFEDLVNDRLQQSISPKIANSKIRWWKIIFSLFRLTNEIWYFDNVTCAIACMIKFIVSNTKFTLSAWMDHVAKGSRHVPFSFGWVWNQEFSMLIIDLFENISDLFH